MMTGDAFGGSGGGGGGGDAPPAIQGEGATTFPTTSSVDNGRVTTLPEAAAAPDQPVVHNPDRALQQLARRALSRHGHVLDDDWRVEWEKGAGG
jgi:hypothetical protein